MLKKIQAGIRFLIGPFGCGKGTVNAIIGTQEMDDEERYQECETRTAELQDKFNRKYTLPPQRHVVHSNFDLKHGDKEAYKFDEDTFMLPDKKYKYEIFEPCACFHIEEGQSKNLNGYEWSSFPKPALLAYARLRHNKYLFTIDLQNLDDLNKKIRRFAFEYVRPLYIENDYNRMNVLMKTTVTTAVFYSYNKALEFQDTEDLSLVDEFRDYTYYGDIYSCFDSEGKRFEYYEEADADKDFCYGTSIKVDEVKEVKQERKAA